MSSGRKTAVRRQNYGLDYAAFAKFVELVIGEVEEFA